ncbi:MAG TPA: phosphatase PAP2 family protein [Puia sp.]|jgi:membrane-associated phospholipid phosphatase|nr:phosphatase PAP2 family protein [Puia sp.]
MSTGASLTRVKAGVPLTLRNAAIATGCSLGYLLLARWLIGFQPDQLVLVILFNSLFYLSGVTRRFILGFTVFIVFWILFDSMKAFPNYRYNTVHIESIYRLEKKLFGIGGQTLNEYWLAHRTTFLDVLSGIYYLCWIPLPLAFAGYLSYRDKELLFRYTLTFLLVNLIGFVIYYVYPAAPPWYVQEYGFGFNPHTPGNVAGLGRFDQYFHVTIFSALYSKSSNVFAAMPSLHAAYPLTVLYYGMKYRLGWINILFAAIMVGIWFAAVYSGHHYVLDVLAGIACGFAGIGVFNLLYGRLGWLNRLVKGWAQALKP